MPLWREEKIKDKPTMHLAFGLTPKVGSEKAGAARKKVWYCFPLLLFLLNKT